MTSEGRIGSVPEPDRDSQLGYRIAARLSNRSAPSSFPHPLGSRRRPALVSGTRRSLQLREPLALTPRPDVLRSEGGATAGHDASDGRYVMPATRHFESATAIPEAMTAAVDSKKQSRTRSPQAFRSS